MEMYASICIQTTIAYQASATLQNKQIPQSSPGSVRMQCKAMLHVLCANIRFDMELFLVPAKLWALSILLNPSHSSYKFGWLRRLIKLNYFTLILNKIPLTSITLACWMVLVFLYFPLLSVHSTKISATSAHLAKCHQNHNAWRAFACRSSVVPARPIWRSRVSKNSKPTNESQQISLCLDLRCSSRFPHGRCVWSKATIRLQKDGDGLSRYILIL